MPKIPQIQSHNDSSFQVENIPKRDFLQKSNPNSSRLKQKSLQDSVVPIYEVNYNPQFSKSPLANVQIQRQTHIRPVQQFHQQSVYYDFSPKVQQAFQQTNKTDWKTILCWVLACLAILALIVGLYFIVDAILGHRLSSKKAQEQLQNLDTQLPHSPSGIVPIYVSPIPYNGLPSYAEPIKTSSGGPPRPIDSPNTYPSTLPNRQSPAINPQSGYQSSEYKVDQPTSPSTPVNQKNTGQGSLTLPTSLTPSAPSLTPSAPSPTPSAPSTTPTAPNGFKFDPQENSIQPLNVYEKKPV